MGKYAILHCHTDYSFRDSICQIPALVNKIKELNIPAAAITDHGHLHGVVEFYRECQSNNVKPIIGVEAYIVESEIKTRKSHHIILLAENNEGLANIIRLITWANQPPPNGGFYYTPRITLKKLFELNKGIIVLTACVHGLIPHYLVEDYPKAIRLVKQFKDVFSDRFYLEVQNVNYQQDFIPEQKIILKRSATIGKKFGIKVVATTDIHYLSADDKFTHDIWKAISNYKTVFSKQFQGFQGIDYYPLSYEEMCKRFPRQFVDNTNEIAERCNVEIKIAPGSHLPKYNSELDDDATFELLVKTIKKNIKKYKIFNPKDERYIRRLKKELRDIKEANLQHYFMLVHDVCKFADDNGIARGPGRGSGAGSLVVRCLNITKPDPIKYGLYWERFYNRGRKESMPDLDLDFDVLRREEIIDYLRRRFGENKVFPMCTITSLAGKAALKDVGRALDYSFDFMNDITKHFPEKANTISEALTQSPTLRRFARGFHPAMPKIIKKIKKSKGIERKKLVAKLKTMARQMRLLFEHAQKIEGCKRQRSTHACAILISDTDIDGKIPLVYDTRHKKLLTGWDMHTLEKLGYLKLDILGIKSITVINKIRQLLKKHGEVHNEKQSEQLDDPHVFNMIGQGRTVGIFQLESHLGRKWCRKIKPSNILEWSDVIALIRPAVLETGMAQAYVDGDTENIPILNSILERTRGVPLYQEQLIAIAREIADFSLTEADNLRRCIGKKLPEEIVKYKSLFIKNVTYKYDKEFAERLWQLIEAAAGYGFNLSHSISYAYLGYVMAWYKLHYPLYFYLAMLQLSFYEQNKYEEIQKLYYDAKKFCIDILPPNVRVGNMDFAIKNGKIYYGLGHIKFLSSKVSAEIKKLKNIKTMFDFWSTLHKERIHKRIVLPLISSGAMSFLPLLREGKLSRLLAEVELFYGLTHKFQERILNSYKGGIYETILSLDEKATRRFKKLPRLLNEFRENCQKTVHDIFLLEKEYTGVFMRTSPHMVINQEVTPIGELNNGGTIGAYIDDWTITHKGHIVMKLVDHTGMITGLVEKDDENYKKWQQMVETTNVAVIEGEKIGEDILLVKSINPISAKGGL